jgi:hypothetical protein
MSNSPKLLLLLFFLLISTAPASEKEVFVWVCSWLTTAGPIVDGELRWSRDNYAYARHRNGITHLNYPTHYQAPAVEPAYGSPEYHQIQYQAALADLKAMKAAGFDAALYDMQPAADFDPASPLSAQNRPLLSFSVFREWLKAGAACGMKVGLGYSVALPPPGVDGLILRLGLVLDQVKDDPALWRIDGKPVLGAFGTSLTAFRKYSPAPDDPAPDGGWRRVIRGLRDQGRSLHFLAHAHQNDENMIDWRLAADSLVLFGPAASKTYQIKMHEMLRNGTRDTIPIVWSVSPGYYSPRLKAWTQPDFERIHTLTLAAVAAKAQRMEVLTWNDWYEDTDIAPSANKGRVLLDLHAYYNDWFKRGVQPPIVRDRVFVAYPICIPEKILSKGNYAPRAVYWSLLKKSRTLRLGGRIVNLPEGVSYGELGDVKPGEVDLALDGKSRPVPRVLSAESEGVEAGGIFKGYGMHFRYVDVTVP